MLTLVKRAEALTWWHDHRDIVPDWLEIYLSLEPVARPIRTYEPQQILRNPHFCRPWAVIEEAVLRSTDWAARFARRAPDPRERKDPRTTARENRLPRAVAMSEAFIRWRWR